MPDDRETPAQRRGYYALLLYLAAVFATSFWAKSQSLTWFLAAGLFAPIFWGVVLVVVVALVNRWKSADE